MKTPKLSAYVSSLTVAILSITSIGATAQVTPPSFTPPNLVITLDAVAKLSPPAASGGGGTASISAVTTPPVTTPTTGPTGGATLDAIDVDGKTYAQIGVSTHGLSADTYTVSVTKQSDGSSVTLGTFAIAATTNPPPATASLLAFLGFGGNCGSGNDHGGRVVFGGPNNPLPTGFNAFDVATISVADSTGTVDLTGDLTQNNDEVKNARLIADSSVPKANGAVSIFVSNHGGKTTTHFALLASGLPAGGALELAINGTDVQAVTPDSHGRVSVFSLPATVDLTNVKSVTIHNAANVNLLSASF